MATLKEKTFGVTGATWVAPDLEAVVNCSPEDGAHFKVYVSAMKARLAKQESMEAQWYKKFPNAFKKGSCIKDKNFQSVCPPDLTKDMNEDAYKFLPKGPAISVARGPRTG